MRRSGILLPVSSLPSRFGIGGMGQAARSFADRLSAAGQSLWQVLPLTVPDFVHSPYASPSAFAGSPDLIDPAELVTDGWLRADELEEQAFKPAPVTDYARGGRVKDALLRRAHARFCADGSPAVRRDFAAFCHDASFWLEDYALFSAIRGRFGGAPVWKWPEDLQSRGGDAVRALGEKLSEEVQYRQFLQFVFQRQLMSLRAYLSDRGISLLGDIPFYVAGDSADVWAHPELFSHTEVAGVPPDFFSADGQLWGNPIYDWERMEADGYDWWIHRLARCAEMYDETRLDHFRALDSYYAIPKGAADARTGTWRRGPGRPFFDLLSVRLPRLSLVAEDLGDITPGVTALREYAELPGMRVLQFAFDGDAGNPFLPHNYDRRSIAYLGTHDNDTSAGFWEKADDGTKKQASSYLGIAPRASAASAVRAMMRAVSASAADTVVFTLQDVLCEDSSRRINTPSKVGGCFAYGLTRMPTAEDFAFLSEITSLYGRQKSHTTREESYG